MLKCFLNSSSRRASFASAAMLTVAACASAPEPAPPAPVAPKAPAAPIYQISDLLGADLETVEALLGTPALTRREGAGEYRRYTLSTCTLIVILYPDDMGVRHVAHVDTTALGSAREKPDLEACLAAG